MSLGEKIFDAIASLAGMQLCLKVYIIYLIGRPGT